MKETFKEIFEERVMKEDLEDPDGQGLTRFFSNACYSCGDKGHFSQDCTKESQEYLGDFPTEKVELDPHEIEGLIRTSKSRKRNQRHPENNPIPAKKDHGHIMCFRCKELGHYADQCRKKKQRPQGADITIQKPRDLSEVICFHCREAGHYANKCPGKKKAGTE